MFIALLVGHLMILNALIFYLIILFGIVRKRCPTISRLVFLFSFTFINEKFIYLVMDVQSHIEHSY